MARKLRIGDTCPGCGWQVGTTCHRLAHEPDPKVRMWTKPEWAEYRRTGRKPSWDQDR